MSAPNFKIVNAHGYYVLGDDDWECDDYEFLYSDMQDSSPALLRQDLASEKYDVGDCDPNKEWETAEWNDRSYQGTLLASARIYPEGDFHMPYTRTLVECSVIMNIYWVSGYYAGATLDWDLGIRYEETKMLSEYGNKEELIEDVADYIFQDFEYYEADRETPKKRTALKKWLTKIFDTYADKADEFCKQHCTQKLNCVGVFSNGEAVYAKA
jgi:hypothetical protein